MNNPQILYRAQRFRVERVVQTTPDGHEHEREIVRHPGAAVVLPLLPDGRVVFVRIFRAAVGETLIELPAGTLDRDEPPRETALRELAEETGYRAGKIEHLLTYCMSPGILDEKMHLFLATELTPGVAALEAGEEIEPFYCSWDEALNSIRSGEIHDAKSLVGLLYYEKFFRYAKA
ncbi:MAG: NUDIX hydrolase [Pirellulales bacterium]|nr:NUDIX hydrolase [Pirellulales bacterium]